MNATPEDLELDEMVVDGTPDKDGEVAITTEYTSSCWSCGDGEATKYLGREDAQKIVARLTAVFGLERGTPTGDRGLEVSLTSWGDLQISDHTGHHKYLSYERARGVVREAERLFGKPLSGEPKT